MDSREGTPAELPFRHDVAQTHLPHAGEDDLGALRLLVAGHELSAHELEAGILKAVVGVEYGDHGCWRFYALASANALLV
jgi:hypothetical protein